MSIDADVTHSSDTGWHLYLMRCSDGSLYTGITRDVPRRERQHASGAGSKYVRSRLPAHVVTSWPVGSKSTALRAEAALRRLQKPDKEAAIGAPDILRHLNVSHKQEISDESQAA